MTRGEILVVEDEGIVALDIKKTLEGLGYSVLAIASSNCFALFRGYTTEMNLREQGSDWPLSNALSSATVVGFGLKEKKMRVRHSTLLFQKPDQDTKEADEHGWQREEGVKARDG